jgi:ABC-type lipoprotein export system ATPase subunit
MWRASRSAAPSAPCHAAADGAPLLRFHEVSKGYPDGRRRIEVLERVSFEIHHAEHVGVLGARRSGKSTLLRLAAGIQAPDVGRIEFEGRDLGEMSTLQRDRLLRERIGLLASDVWRPAKGERAVDIVALPLVSDGATMSEARARARKALHHTGATDYADDPAVSLGIGERVRVMLARALVREPSLLLVDEPAAVPSLGDREELYELLRDSARRHRAALVIASEDSDATRGADVLMKLGYGELLQTGGEPANVLPFPPRHTPRQPGGLERAGS